MKVAVATSWPDDPSAPAGGVEAVSVNLTQALAEYDDLEIHLVTTKQTCSSLRTEKWGKIVVHRLPWAGGSTLWNAVGPGRRQLHRCLAEIKPDIVHAHDTYGLMVQGVVMPCVFTVHGFIHMDTALKGGRFSTLRALLWRWLETEGWARQRHIISISPYVRDRLKSIARGAIYDIDNPVAAPFFQVKGAEKRGAIFSAAAISRLKNTAGLVEGFARLCDRGHDATLRLAGTCHEAEYGRRLRQFIHDRNLDHRITFLGSLTAEQVRAELGSTSIFALVSLHENAPLSIGEAMAAGVPVVTSNRCGMPYMVREGESGFLVDPTDPEGIARRLEEILTNDPLRQSMRAAGREIARDRFRSDQVARRTRDVYLKVLQGG